MNTTAPLRNLIKLVSFGLALAVPPQLAQAQEWGAAGYFKYNIDNVRVDPAASPALGYDVTVIFSVTDPSGNRWDIKDPAGPFTATGAGLTLDIGWNPNVDFTNTGSSKGSLSSVVGPALGTGAAIPVQVRGLQLVKDPLLVSPSLRDGVVFACDATSCPPYTAAQDLTNRYYVRKNVVPVPRLGAVTTGRIAIEGKPACRNIPGYTCQVAGALVPVKSATADFAFAASPSLAALIPDPRRKVVDINKCKQCHDGNQHGDVVIPKLSLHGTNRTENLGLCVVCHNPNQTDVPYRYQTAGTPDDPRIAGRETPIDFKVMVHAIHAGGFRKTPYVVVGFQSSVNDFSDVRFPRELRKSCPDCHIEANGKGTYELPIKATLGTTVNTNSNYLVAKGNATRSISVDPADDLRMTPIAATCSACHDNAEVRSHMVKTGGASFSTQQANIGTTIKEKCANCHGPGKDKDVRKVHEIGSR